MQEENLNRDFIFNLLPFVIVVLASTISFKLSGVSSGGGEVAFVNDPRRLIVLGTAYALAVVVLYNNIEHSIVMIGRQWPYLLLLMYVITSMLWSENPTKVVIGFGHYIGVFLSISAISICFKKDRELTLIILSIVFSFTLLLSIVASVAMPAIGLHIETGRWQGVTGNPNTLGATCISAMWINVTLFSITKSIRKKIFIIIGVFFVLIALVGARSMTSILVTFTMTFGVYLLAIIENKGKVTKFLIVAFSFSLVLSLVLLLYIVYPEQFTVERALDSIGKDATLTGRTDIWEVAIMLIKERPVIGFSFDSLLSVFDHLGYIFSQFHNGYLDYIVRGGTLGMLWFVFILIWFGHMVKKIASVDSKYATAVVGLLLAILVHNLTEASIMRSSMILWIMFVFIMCTTSSINYRSQSKQ